MLFVMLACAPRAAHATPPDVGREEPIPTTTAAAPPSAAPFAPPVALVAPVLADAAHATELSLRAGYDPLGVSLAAAEIAAGVTLARAFGPLRVAATASVARPVGTSDDETGDFGAAAMVPVLPLLELGAAFHARTELVNQIETADDGGRPAELLGGAMGALDLGPVRVTTIAGAISPRGFAPSGVLSLTRVGIAF